MKVRKIVFIGLFSSIAFVLMSTITIPIIPHAPYLRYDPSEIISIFAAVSFDTWTGVMVCFIKNILYFFFRAKSIFGPTADFIAGSTFTFIVGIVYHLNKNNKTLILGGVIATLARILIIIPMNIIILHLQFGLSTGQVFKMLLPILVPFNSLKSIINFVVFYILFSILLKRPSFSKKYLQFFLLSFKVMG